MTDQPVPRPDHRPPRIPSTADDGGCCCGRCRVDDRVPFGLPVLDEVPELAGLLQDLVAIDRLVARVIDALIVAEDTSLSEATTGLPLERWLAAIAGRTRTDRRMLATAAQACRRLPGVHAAFREGRLSWAQLRTLALRLQQLPRLHDQAIDDELCVALHTTGPRPDPDSLLCVVAQVLAAHDRQGSDQQAEAAPDADFLAMQPRLDGSGGTVYGDFGPAGFAAIDNRLAPDAPDGPTRDGFAADAHPERARATGRQLARSRAQKLIELCTHRNGQDAQDGDELEPVPASYVARVDVETLLQLAPDRAGRLLTTLTGGAMWLDADTARALADAHGTSLRLVLHDRGRVVGVGRTTTKTPGWLAEATLAVHDTCTAPGCAVAARLCHTDHAVPVAARGPTDIANLAPLCATDNHAKEPGGWRCTQHPDGRRSWHHEATGLITTTLPATWRSSPAHDADDHAPPGAGDEGRAQTGGDEGRAPSGTGEEGRAPPADPGDGRPSPPTHREDDRAPPHEDTPGDDGGDLPF